MEKNFDCKYYPCHDNIESCELCYCPIYPCEVEELGKYIKDKNNNLVWDCSNCEIIHKEMIVKLINQVLNLT